METNIQMGKKNHKLVDLDSILKFYVEIGPIDILFYMANMSGITINFEN